MRYPAINHQMSHQLSVILIVGRLDKLIQVFKLNLIALKME